MPGHYRMKGTKPAMKKTTMNKKMTMNKAVPKKGSPAMKMKMAKLRSLKGKK